MVRKQILRILSLVIATSALVLAQSQGTKKSYTMRGKVEAVDQKAAKVTVHNENVPGWMAEMTMSYKVDNPAILKDLKPGDAIEATVYDGDEVLHKVRLAKQNK